jgi:hypothetical protein
MLGPPGPILTGPIAVVRTALLAGEQGLTGSLPAVGPW